MAFTMLRRAASRSACQVAWPRRATRSTARQIVLRCTRKPKPSCNTAATLRGQRHGDHLIDLLRNRFAVMLAVGGTGLAPWWPRVGFPLTAGKGCGLSLVGPLGFFQLALQPLVFLTQPFSFPTKPPLLLAQLLVFLAQSLILGASTAPLLLKGGDLLL